jgi:hypothetical protein
MIPPDAAERPRREWSIDEALIAGLALVLLLGGLASVPGLHGDEAWTIARVKAIAGGERPLSGMNFYTGAVYEYLLWPAFESFGYRLTVLRAFAALLNVAALLIGVRLVRQLHPGGSEHRWFGLLLCTSPAFVVFSRVGVEITALTPVLVALALWAFFEAHTLTGRKAFLAAASGGLCLGLAAYNHVLAGAVPFALGMALLLVYRSAFLSHAACWGGLLGVIAGLSPRGWIALAEPAASGWRDRLAELAELRFLGDLVALPEVLQGLWNGSLLYLRTTGKTLLWVAPYGSVAFLVSLIAWLAMGGPRRLARRDVAWLLFGAILLLAIVVITPWFALHYFALPIFGAYYLLVRLSAPLRQRAETRWLGVTVLGAVIVLNVFYVVADYFVAFARDGGSIAVFPLGSRLTETSNHFISTERVHRELHERGIELALGDDLLYWQLRYHEADHPRPIQIGYWPPTQPPPDHPELLERRAALVYFDGPTSFVGRLVMPPEGDVIGRAPVLFRRDPGFDPHFRVYVSRSVGP